MQSWKMLVLVFTIIFYSGCRTPEPQSELIEINIERNVQNVKPLSICDLNGELRYIPLRGNSVQLRTIILTDFYQDLMLATDRFTCVLCDLQGNIVAKIGNRGKGPGEYSLIMSMKFGAHGRIYLQDGRIFNEYDLKGNYLRMFKPAVNPEKITAVGGGTMYSWAPYNDSLFIGQVANDSGKEKYKAVFFNEMGKTVFAIPNHIFLNKAQPYSDSNNSDAWIYELEGKTYFKELYNDTVFRVNDQFVFEPAYYFNFGKYGLPKSVRELPMSGRTEEREKYIGMRGIYETSQYLFLDCDFRNHSPAKRSEPFKYKDPLAGQDKIWWFYPAGMLGIYDKSSNELVFAEPVKSDDNLTNDGLYNDYDGGVHFYPRTRVNDSTLAMWVDAWEFKLHVASRAFKNSTPKYPEKKKELERLATGLNDSDNPVLILCTFKK